jgi:hypothetical protein
MWFALLVGVANLWRNYGLMKCSMKFDMQIIDMLMENYSKWDTCCFYMLTLHASAVSSLFLLVMESSDSMVYTFLSNILIADSRQK